jgi:hypothetical protein
MHNLIDLIFSALSCVTLSSGGTSSFCKKWIIPVYHSHEDKYSATHWLLFCFSVDISVYIFAAFISIRLMPIKSQFSFAKSLARLWPLTNLVGFTSMSNSISFAIHFALFPSISG